MPRPFVHERIAVANSLVVVRKCLMITVGDSIEFILTKYLLDFIIREGMRYVLTYLPHLFDGISNGKILIIKIGKRLMNSKEWIWICIHEELKKPFKPLIHNRVIGFAYS